MPNDSELVTRAILKEELANFKMEFKAEFKAELSAEIAAAEERMDKRFEGRMDTLEQRMRDATREMIHDSETRLLQAFYGFAETTHKLFAQGDITATLLTGRVNTLEDRVFEIEKRLNMPPTV